jgi:hypothetical protein
MKLILHHALKDVRLLKWILAIWVLLNVALYVTVLVGVGLPAAQVAEGRPLVTMFATLRALVVASFFAIPVIIVQSDPAMGTTATWFTRPLSWRALFAAKVLVAVPLFALLPEVGDLTVLLIAGVPFGTAAGLALEAIAVQAAWLFAVLALAAITITLAQFVVAVLLELTLYFSLALGVRVFGGAVWVSRGFGGARVASPETMQVAFVGTTIVVGLGLVLFAYKRRSMTQGAVLAGFAPVIIAVTTVLWPWDTARSLGPTIVSPVQVRLAPDLHCGVDARPYPYDCAISGDVLFSDVPAGQSVQLITWSGWLQYGAERVPLLRVAVGNGDPTGNAPGQPGRAMLQVLGGQVLTRGSRGSVPAFHTMRGWVPAPHSEALENQPGTLDATFEVVTLAHRERATNSVSVGATYPLNTGRGEILSVERYARGVTVIARETGLDFRQDRFVGHDYALRNARRGEVLLEYKRGFTVTPFTVATALIPVPQHLASIWWELDFAWPDHPSFDADAWLRDARLVVVESERVGVSDKHVQVPGIVLSKLPGWGK